MNLRLQSITARSWAVFMPDNQIRVCSKMKELQNLLNRVAVPADEYEPGIMMLCPICSCEFISIEKKDEDQTECPQCTHKF